MRTMGMMVAFLVASGAGAAEQRDPVPCEPVSAPIVLERRSDGLVVAHLEWSAPLGAANCDAYPVRAIYWGAYRYDSAGSGMDWPWRHPLVSCPGPGRKRGERCADTERIIVRPGGAGLYGVLVQVERLDGAFMSWETYVRVGRRPASAR